MPQNQIPQPAPSIDPAQTRLATELKHTSPLFGCRFDPEGKFVFATVQENSVVRFELAGGKKTLLAGHKSWQRGLAFAAKEKLCLTAGYDGQLIAWPLDAESPTPRWQVEAHKGWARAVVVSPDGSLVASCGNDYFVRLWSPADGKLIRTLEGHACHVYNVAFHPDGKHLVSADLKGVVKQWDLATGKLVRDLDASVLYKYDPTFRADIGGVRSMAFSADGSLLACAGITNVSNAFAGIGNPMIVLFDWASGKTKLLLKPKEAFQGTMWGVVFHPQGYVIGTAGGNGGALWFWKPDAAADVFALKIAQNVRDLALHPDGTRVALACFDGVVRLYDLTPKPAPK
jgi:WD40 repeat protein